MMQVNFWCCKVYFFFRVTHDLFWTDHSVVRNTDEPEHGSELPRIYQLVLVDNGCYMSAQTGIQ